MKRMMAAAMMSVMVMAVGAGTARGAGFAGNWVNIDSTTGSLVRIEIERSKFFLSVHPWATCTPTPCDWGVQTAPVPVGNWFEIVFDQGFKTVTLTITQISDNSLWVHAFHDYAPGDPRTDFSADLYFQLEGSGTPKPDLEITEMTIEKPVVVSQAVPWTWVTATVRNNGPGVLSTGTIKAVFESCSLNGVPKTHGGYMIFDYTAPLMPGQEVTHDFAVGTNSDWPVGCHTIRLMVDPDNTIAESNERNNLSAALAFDIAEERFLSGTIEYNNQPLTDFTQVPILDPWIRDLTTDEPLEDFFFWYNTQTGHYLFSGLPNDELWIQEHIRIAGPTDILGGNYRIGHTVDMPSLTDAEAMAYDIPVERIVHLLEPQDNGQILEYSQAYWQCPGTRFEWEPLVGAVKYRIRINTFRDPSHPSGYGFVAAVLETEVTDPFYSPDLPVPLELHHYQMILEGYNAADEKLGSYWYSFAGAYTGYGFDYRFKICPSCVRGDINRDCRVTLLDFAILAEEWLVDTR